MPVVPSVVAKKRVRPVNELWNLTIHVPFIVKKTSAHRNCAGQEIIGRVESQPAVIDGAIREHWGDHMPNPLNMFPKEDA